MPERTKKAKPLPQKGRTSRKPAAVAAAPARRLTPLARTLKEKPDKRATPLDAFMLARSKWERGERLDIGQIASELGVGRATLFRWVGSREQLYGELFVQAYTRLRERIAREAIGKGPDLVADYSRRTLKTLFGAPAMRKFIEQDPEYAIRILTSKSSPVQERIIQIEATLLRALAAKGEIEPAIEIDTLAYLIVRIGESFLYGDVISGRDPDLDAAATAVRILVAARPGGRGKKK